MAKSNTPRKVQELLRGNTNVLNTKAISNVSPYNERLRRKQLKMAEEAARVERFTFAGWDNAIILLVAFMNINALIASTRIGFEQGSIAYLIMYGIVLFVIIKPSIQFEILIAQFCSKAPTCSFSCMPLLKGASLIIMLQLVFSVMNQVHLCIYTFHFMEVSHSVPYTSCSNDYNTPQCFTYLDEKSKPCNLEQLKLCRRVSNKKNEFVSTEGYDNVERIFKSQPNITCKNTLYKVTKEDLEFQKTCHNKTRDSGTEFFYNSTLSIAPKFSHMKDLKLVPALLRPYILVHLIMTFLAARGMQFSANIFIMLLVFPLLLLFIMCLMLMTEGQTMAAISKMVATETLEFTPKRAGDVIHHILGNFDVFVGLLASISSYRAFDRDLKLDVNIIVWGVFFMNLVFSIFITALLSNYSVKIGVNVNDVYNQSYDNLPVIIPNALASVSLTPIHNFLFYATAFFWSLCSSGVNLECLLVNIEDYFPKLKHIRPLISLVVVALLGTANFVVTTNNGYYIKKTIQRVHDLLRRVSQICFAIICAIYGLDRLELDWEIMVKSSVPGLTVVIMLVVIPTSYLYLNAEPLLGIFGKIQVGNEIIPNYITEKVVLMSCCVCLIVILGGAFFAVIESGYNWRSVFSPSEEWGPKNPVRKNEYDTIINDRNVFTLKAYHEAEPFAEFVYDDQATEGDQP